MLVCFDHVARFIVNAVLTGGGQVVVNSVGQLGRAASSERFKAGIRPIGEESEAILALRPVTFRYKKEIDPQRMLQFGLVAEEVEKVNPDLVVRDSAGDPYTVRYDAVNAMLLNEFLKEHRRGGEQDRKVERLEATVTQQQTQIEALTAGLQKVSAQLAAASPSDGGLEASKPAPQVVSSNQ